MLSRVANSIYWMSRYLERANNVSRFVEVNLHLILDMNLSRKQMQWEPLVITSGDNEDFLKRYHYADEKNVVRFLTFDEKNPNSITSCILLARENARTVRESIPSELWETINELYHLVKKNSRKRKLNDLQSFYGAMNQYGNLMTGVYQDTFSHSEAWHFSQVGMMLERADKTARMLDVKYFLLLPSAESTNTPYDTVEWSAVLKSASAFEMYRKQYHSINCHNVANFLLFDPHFPRAIKYCINTAARSLQSIIDLLNIEVRAKDEMLKLQEMLSKTNIEQILNNGLHEFIDIFQLNINVLDRAIYESFFIK